MKYLGGDMGLTAKQDAFINEYMIDFNGARAAVAAGYSEKSAKEIACETLTNPHVATEITKRKAIIASEVKLEVKDVVRAITQILRADPRDLIEYRLGACRHCHGTDFGYQFTPAEFHKYCADHYNSKAGIAGEPLDMKGGMGYTPKREPHPDCPECFGEGVAHTYAKDSRTLSADAAALYMGTKPTANGIEILMRSKDKAIEQAARYLGMNKLDLNLIRTIKAKDLTDDELAEIAKGVE